MKARFGVSGNYCGTQYDSYDDRYDIDYELAKSLNNGDIIWFKGRNGEETQVTVIYKWVDLIDNELELHCEC